MDTNGSEPFASDSRESLVARVQQLTAELRHRDEAERKAAERTGRLRRLAAKVWVRVYTGSRLYEAARTAWDDWSVWLRAPIASGGWPERATRDLVAALLARFTRIGVTVVVLAMMPVALALMQLTVLTRQNELLNHQNALVEHQNTLTDLQTELAESSRRSTLVFEQTSILDEIDEELDAFSASNGFERARLSPRLEGRIVALSKSLRPYRYLQNGRLTERPQSPERGQLLLALANSGVDMSYIFSHADFSYADLPGTSLTDTDLSNQAVPGRMGGGISLIGANFRGSIFSEVSLRDTHMPNTDFRHVTAVEVDFRDATLIGANFTNARIYRSDFRGSNMGNATFRGTSMVNAKLSGTHLTGANFRHANLTGIVFTEYRESDNPREIVQALCTARTLQYAQLHPDLVVEINRNAHCARKLRPE